MSNLGQTLLIPAKGTSSAAVATVGALAPGSISGLVLHLDANAQTGFVDGDPVSTWTATVGPNATSTGTARPTYKTAILNSKPVMRLLGTDDFMQTAALDLSGTDDITVVAVTNAVTSTGGMIVVEQGTNAGTTNGAFYLSRDTGNYGEALMRAGGVNSVFRTTTVAPALLWTTLPRIVTATYDRSLGREEVVVYINGVYGGGSEGSLVSNTTDSDTSGNFLNQAIYIGARAGTSLFLIGDVAEVLIYSRRITDRERVRLGMYLNEKWDVHS